MNRESLIGLKLRFGKYNWKNINWEANGCMLLCDVLDGNQFFRQAWDIVYTDNSVDKDGNTQVFAFIYNSDSNEQRLIPIETEKEWKIVEIILEELQANI